MTFTGCHNALFGGDLAMQEVSVLLIVYTSADLPASLSLVSCSLCVVVGFNYSEYYKLFQFSDDCALGMHGIRPVASGKITETQPTTTLLNPVLPDLYTSHPMLFMKLISLPLF